MGSHAAADASSSRRIDETLRTRLPVLQRALAAQFPTLPLAEDWL